MPYMPYFGVLSQSSGPPPSTPYLIEFDGYDLEWPIPSNASVGLRESLVAEDMQIFSIYDTDQGNDMNIVQNGALVGDWNLSQTSANVWLFEHANAAMNVEINFDDGGIFFSDSPGDWDSTFGVVPGYDYCFFAIHNIA